MNKKYFKNKKIFLKKILTTGFDCGIMVKKTFFQIKKNKKNT
jgi:hypothetical protein